MELLFLQYLTTVQWDNYGPYTDIISDRDPRTAQGELLRDFSLISQNFEIPGLQKFQNLGLHRTRAKGTKPCTSGSLISS